MKATKVTCSVKSKEFLTPTVFELRFGVEPTFEFIPGQFISLLIPGVGPNGRDLRRAYSLASPPESHQVELCMKLVSDGKGTPYLNSLKEGDTFSGQAPFGDFVYVTPSNRNVMFIATGTGISPFRSMIFSELFRSNTPRKATLLFGVRTEDEVLYSSTLGADQGVERIDCVSRPAGDWSGNRGRVSDYLRQSAALIDWAGTDFYMCGNGEMIKEVLGILSENNVDKKQIYQEKYY